MRVYVSSPSASISPQILAYAEYRVFAALARYAGVRGARVILRQEAGGVRCSVTIDFETAASARASARGLQVAGAIDRATERVARLMHRRCQPDTAAASG